MSDNVVNRYMDDLEPQPLSIPAIPVLVVQHLLGMQKMPGSIRES